MKLLITGDIHGKVNRLEMVLNEEAFDLHLNTGDLGINDNLVNKSKMRPVKGNCDFFSQLPTELIVDFGGKKILLVHGHLFGVKNGYDNLIEYATNKGVDICIFGHTHIKDTFIKNNILFINPGALGNRENASYAIYENDEVIFKDVN